MKLIKYFIIIVLTFGNDSLFAKEYIVLLHGLWRTSFSMQFLDAYLRHQGFKTININYPSTHYPIEQLTDIVAEKINRLGQLKSADKVHFVTHSMGGIIVRDYLATNQLDNLGRVVMLSPPNQGCDLASIFRDNTLFRYFAGPAGQQLGIELSSFPNQLGTVNFDLGIIAGNVSVDPVLSYIIPGDDDGVISVESTKVEGMRDFLIVPYSHVFIMNSYEVREQIVYFLKQGQFYH